MDTRSVDLTHLRLALDLAARGPAVDPNPRVGAVLVRGDDDAVAPGVMTGPSGSGEYVVGVGWHEGAGTAHAEIMALREAGPRAEGATAYITLEPCAHVGRTGACVDALLDAGVARVVFAQHEPNAVALGGADRLRAAGVEVEGGLLADEAAALNTHWSFAVEHGRPFVTWKVAATLDGRSAAADGSSRWITGEQARADVHRLRATAGAVLVGIGTVLIDDPQLTVRTAGPPVRQPLRVVVGERDIPTGARVLDDAAPLLRVRTHDPHVALKEVQQQQVRHVLLEGGPTVAAAFLRADLVDEVVAYVAPALLGDGAPMVGSLGFTGIGDASRFELYDVARVGGDVRMRMRPIHRSKSSIVGAS